MDKIETLDITPTSYDVNLGWREIMQEIRDETNNFDPETMCKNCIKKQLSYGVIDPVTKLPKRTISCTGLASAENALAAELGEEITEEFIQQFIGVIGKEAYDKLAEYENPFIWADNNIPDKKLFSPREHQNLVAYCTARNKVLRMGRRAGKTFVLTIAMLHRLLTRPGYEILMVAPMVTMITEVADSLKKFCQTLPINPITRSTSSPITIIEFNTGSVFKGVPAGSEGAMGVRGKSCLSGETYICLELLTYNYIQDSTQPAYYLVSLEDSTTLSDDTYSNKGDDLIYTISITTNINTQAKFLNFVGINSSQYVHNIKNVNSVYQTGFLGAGEEFEKDLCQFGPYSYIQELLFETKDKEMAINMYNSINSSLGKNELEDVK